MYECMNIVQPDALFVHIYTIDNIAAAAAAAAVTVEQSVVYVSFYTYIYIQLEKSEPTNQI